MSKTINLGRVKGEDATINGVNALTIESDGSITAIQSGSTLTLGVDITSGAVKSELDKKLDETSKGTANGIAELDSNGKVPSAQLPSYVDDVIEGYYNDGTFYEDSEYATAITPETGKIYIDLASNKTYRWSGSTYVAISSDIALGETSSTAYRGDRGKEAYDHSQVTSGNPHNVTKSDVGLDSVVNTGDSETPVEGGTTKFTTGGAYTELAKKMNKVSGTSDQLIGFDSSGNPTAINISDVVDIDANAYGFEIDQSESDPFSRITYIGKNASYKAAYMNYSTGKFDYGDWENVWFIKNIKVVLMAYNGTITKELNKNNYAKDTSGNSVTITSGASGNVMVGIPKVYIKVDSSRANPRVYFSDTKLSSDYHCFAHTDVNGAEIDYTYMAAYDGYSDGTRLRSVSGVTATGKQTYDTQVSQANANNTQGGVSDIWDIGTFGDRMLINFLLMLIGKSTDTQTTFGHGNNNSYVSDTQTGVVNSGTLNDKGLFYGYNTDKSAVKVFGIENYWGNVWKRVQGLINDNGTYKVKLCRSSIDGTTSTAYSSSGSGYFSAGKCPTAAYQTLMNFNTNGFMLPTASTYTPSSSTYYCDYAWYNNSQVDVALFGSGSCHGLGVGAFALALNAAASDSWWYDGASLSAKPIKTS